MFLIYFKFECYIMLNYVILDCYTDEPDGLGVPPYLGVYPRYVAGQIELELKESKVSKSSSDIKYVTIDDLRLFSKYDSIIPETKLSQKTDISVLNLSKNYVDVDSLLKNADYIIIVSGAHTSGKYLSAYPGNLTEISRLLKKYSAKKLLCGPSASEFGSSYEGGKSIGNSQKQFVSNNFDGIFNINSSYDFLKKSSLLGAEIIAPQCFSPFVTELETARGCTRNPGCSFCCVPKSCGVEFRDANDVVEEAKIFRKYTSYFRLGKQSCLFSYKNGDDGELENLLKGISDLKPDVFHIDNVNPFMVTLNKAKLIAKYCTGGNIAAFGAETFDPVVVKENNLNSNPQTTYNAIKIINSVGSDFSQTGLPKFLPGINILFGLIGESKKTHEHNMAFFNKLLDDDLLIRRINIRQVIPFQGTYLYENAGKNGMKFIQKNKKFYWKWRNDIRQNIDFEMLKRLVPIGTVLKNVYMEIYDGNHTFGRQFGTYPLIIGLDGRIPLKKFYDVKVISHNLRSLKVEVIK
jgi:radical SAM superfamily enzyme with C-terminal helix-hairpin-helix motif